MYGREAERRAIAAVAASGGVLVIRGEAGTGKTALLTGAARDGRVLRAAGSCAETGIAFSGLHRLLAPVRDAVDALPRHRAEALRAALDGDGPATDLRVCAAVHDLLTALDALVIVDDADTLDPASLAVLLFCARRATGRTGFLLALGEHGADTRGLPELRLGGLAEADAVRLLGEVDPGTRRLILDTAEGNPLALVELAKATDAERALLTGAPPLPGLYAARVAALGGPYRRALLVAAADDTRRPEIVAAARERMGLAEVDDALLARPLSRAAVYHGADPGERRQTHLALAGVLDEYGEHARARRHRALAATRPDARLADGLERDAKDAAGRGGLAAAVSALLHAARLSVSPGDRARRTASAAHAAWKSGHTDLARSLTSTVDDGETVRLRGLIELYGGHQPTAFATLVRGAAASPPERAAELSFMAVDAALHAGLPDEAIAVAEGIAAAHPDPATRRYGRWLADSAAGKPVPATAWEVYDAAPEPVARSGAHRWILPMAITRGGGREAREFALTATERLRSTGMLALVATPLLWLAELEHRLGMWDEAVAHAREGLAFARDAGQPVAEADLLSLLALVDADRGEASSYATDALALALPLGNRLAGDRARLALSRSALLRGEAAAEETPEGVYGEARADLAEGRLLRRARRPRAAREPLRRAVAAFDALGAVPWAALARDELRASGDAVLRPVADPLTPQEHAVATLAAEGLTNREIGARMFLSPRTVGYHLAKVFQKVGVSARAQLRELEFIR
ncbi:hypothetical protein Afil01_08020 [Actinorhabdospora filicis]|uniref:HTH luxR-type domain-containing protein n=1 Tax=Actinorhabdospora filicis TaxID=1785913 RepID=A0A9W6W8T8_9ACTN|nr:helix-turn-helix transcriptional regulator [Actinorhabdospora filicis]GLZ75995.1 hypothetical protein Afil01_08020 [Actinorhabdospora filicis]